MPSACASMCPVCQVACSLHSLPHMSVLFAVPVICTQNFSSSGSLSHPSPVRKAVPACSPQRYRMQGGEQQAQGEQQAARPVPSIGSMTSDFRSVAEHLGRQRTERLRCVRAAPAGTS